MTRRLFLIALALLLSPLAFAGWDADFAHQPIDKRPRLEVRYTSAARDAFEILAEKYHLRGELRTPHRLVDAKTGKEWLSLYVEGADGIRYSSKNSKPESRINLYRRGPYYCEVHWFDVQVATKEGEAAPLKGDVALYCYPDKILGSVTWHATEDFTMKGLGVEGLAPASFPGASLTTKSKPLFAFALYGEPEPLPDSSFESQEAIAPMKYDPVRGCYTIGSHNPGAFQAHFYDHPNHYEKVKFKVQNDQKSRMAYICHESVTGALGTVEGGVLLDEVGHPLPITVQISKNFAGEKEEKFYNPHDTAFSETFFPLYLGPDESRTISSLHLYQNWGRNMVKQFSSLGAWMDYFHSSTGVTETTCYVPFKFGGLPGVAIADYRPMSQISFWGGQPQHDNVAGHSFLSYKEGKDWQYMTYQGTTYRSTGPNWMDIGLRYLSSDGKIEATVDTFELPQADELRNFIQIHYKILKPVVIDNPSENFRLLTISSHVQGIRYTHFAATGRDPVELSFKNDHFGVTGVPLPTRSAYLTLYGDPRGSNAIVLRNWQGPVEPAASVFCTKQGDTRLLLVPQGGRLMLKEGMEFSIDAFWYTYGSWTSAAPPSREAQCYGSDAPRIVQTFVGSKVSDFPPRMQVEDNTAEFELQGGRDLICVVAHGLTDYRYPRIARKDEHGWTILNHSRVGDLDGVQVFSEGPSTFGAVFLVHSDNQPQRLRVTAGAPKAALPRLVLDQAGLAASKPFQCVSIRAERMSKALLFGFPEAISTSNPAEWDAIGRIKAPWAASEGNSLFFEARRDKKLGVGGRLSPNEEDVDLEFWVANRLKTPVPVRVRFSCGLKGTIFEDPRGERTWVITDRGQEKVTSEGSAPCSAVAVVSEDGKRVCAVAWPGLQGVRIDRTREALVFDVAFPDCPGGERMHERGKLFLVEGTLSDVVHRVRREVLPR